MRFINLYLIGYVVFVLGVVLALWKMGALAHVSGAWIGIGAIVAIGVGIMFAVGAGKPSVTRE
ncbi:MAG: hypothetical protein ABI051_15190 [Vicinamibacterales bacterium]